MTKRIRGTCSNCGGPRYSSNNNLEKPLCKECRKISPPNKIHDNTIIGKREARLKSFYGFEFGEFDAWWIVFKGKCGICSIDLTYPENKRGQSLTAVCIDHDHDTGKVRGLLCNACNKALGLFKDSPDVLKLAITYLEINGKKTSNNS